VTYSSVSAVTKLRAGQPGFDSRHGYGVQSGSGEQPASYRIAPGLLSPGVKRPGREVHHSSQSNVEIKNIWIYTSTPPYVFMAWYLVKHRDNFTFYSNKKQDQIFMPGLNSSEGGILRPHVQNSRSKISARSLYLQNLFISFLS
jgi:hypothetical protein